MNVYVYTLLNTYNTEINHADKYEKLLVSIILLLAYDYHAF